MQDPVSAVISYQLKIYQKYNMKNKNKITKQDIPSLLHEHLPNYNPKLLKIKQIFGMTNQIYKVSQQGKPSVIFRILSQVIDRKYENKVLQRIQEKGLGPKTLYACQQYRIEQFIENASSPSTEDINKNEPLLKKVLSRLHELHEIKLPKQLQKQFFDDVVFTQENKKKYAHAKCQQKGREQQFETLKKKLLQKFKFVKEKLMNHFSELGKKHAMKLTHNDANNNNIFMMEENGVKTNKLLLLDFEYACYNYPAYDIANLLNQCCIQYHNKFPGFQIYKKVSEQQIKNACDFYYAKYEGMEYDIKIMLAICNYYWGLWSLLAKPTEQFSPTDHGKARLQLYEFYMDKLPEVRQI